MAKFKVNDYVIVTATGKKGVVKAREIIKSTDGTKHYDIQYIVKFDEGFDNWGAFSKKELQKQFKNTGNDDKYITKIYDAPNGFKVTLVALTETEKYYEDVLDTCKTMRTKYCNIGHSIYNPHDVYNEKLGYRIAKKRIKTRPFVHMSSSFSGEFNKETVEAIMDVKAAYIIRNLDKMVNR